MGIRTLAIAIHGATAATSIHDDQSNDLASCKFIAGNAYVERQLKS